MVELRRIELLSENKSIQNSTGVGYDLNSRCFDLHSHNSKPGSLLCMTSAETLRHSRSPLVFALFYAVVLTDKTAALRQRMLNFR